MDEIENLKTRIGSKILSEEAIKTILPDYESIYKDIEKIRESFGFFSKSIEKSGFKDKKYEDKFHDNIFSILGERGSGKTSVLKTIKTRIEMLKDTKSDCFKYLNKDQSELEENAPHYKNDIILPMIMPEIMESNDLIGWLIGYFASEVDLLMSEFSNLNNSDKTKILRKYENLDSYTRKQSERSEEFKRCPYENYLKCPVKVFYDNWVKAYVKRASDYKDILKENYVGEREYTRDFIEYLNSDVNLLKNFHEFIDCLAKYLKCKDYCSESLSEEPVIFIFFDDLDLIPYNSVKMLETIIIYLSHANIITFIAGSYENFDERVLLKYLRSDHVLSKELYEEVRFRRSETQTTLSNRRKLTYDFLKKLLTPAYRYYLNSFEIKQRAEFISGEDIYTKNKADTKSKKLSELLNEFLNEFGQSKNIKIPEQLFEILDHNPRGLINLYKFLEDRIGTLSKIKELKNKNIFIKNTIGKLIQLLIVSKDTYNDCEHDLKECLIKNQELDEGKIININYVKLEQLAQKIKKHKNYTEVTASKMIIEFYYLAFFAELFKSTNENLIWEKVEPIAISNFVKWMNWEIQVNQENLDLKVFDSNLFSVAKMMKIRYEILENFGNKKLDSENLTIETWENLLLIFTNENAKNKSELSKEIVISYLNDQVLDHFKWVKNWLSILHGIYRKNSQTGNQIENAKNIIAELNLTKEEVDYLNNESMDSLNIDEAFGIISQNSETKIELFEYIELYEIRRLFYKNIENNSWSKTSNVLNQYLDNKYSEKIQIEIDKLKKPKELIEKSNILDDFQYNDLKTQINYIYKNWDLNQLKKYRERHTKIADYIKDAYLILEDLVMFENTLTGVEIDDVKFENLSSNNYEVLLNLIEDFEEKHKKHYNWVLDYLNNETTARDIQDGFPKDEIEMKWSLFTEQIEFENKIFKDLFNEFQYPELSDIVGYTQIKKEIQIVINHLKSSAEVDFYEDELRDILNYLDRFTMEIETLKDTQSSMFEEYFKIERIRKSFKESYTAKKNKQKMINLIDNFNFENMMRALIQLSLNQNKSLKEIMKTSGLKNKNELYILLMKSVSNLRKQKRLVRSDIDFNLSSLIKKLKERLEVQNQTLLFEHLNGIEKDLKVGLDFNIYKRKIENIIVLANNAELSSVPLFEQLRKVDVVLEVMDKEQFENYLKDVGNMVSSFNSIKKLSDSSYKINLDEKDSYFKTEEIFKDKIEIEKYELINQTYASVESDEYCV